MGLFFQYDTNTRMPERVNLMNIKCADQMFGLGYKPKREDYIWVASMRRERIMAKI
jgi:hypothetical protein